MTVISIKLKIIWHTVDWVSLQHNSYWFNHLIYVLLLHYIGKQVECILITFCPISQGYTV